MAGLAVECALKAIIAKKTKQYEYPDKNLVSKYWTHELNKLAGHAGILNTIEAEKKVNPTFDSNWAQIIQWSIEDRYLLAKTKREAEDFYSAVASYKNGLMPLIRKEW